MIEKTTNNFLGHVLVDQPGAQGMSPLVRCQVHGPAFFVADVAALKPSIERCAVSAAAGGCPTVRVLRWPGKQDNRHLQVAGPGLLFGDHSVQFVVDGNQSFTFHFVVVISEVRRASGVGDNAVVWHGQCIGDPQPAPDQDQSDQLEGGIAPSGEVLRAFDLGHDLFGQRPRRSVRAVGMVAGKQHSGRREGVIPAVLSECLEERVELPDVNAALVPARLLRMQVGQIPFQQATIHVRQASDAHAVTEAGEPGHCTQAAACRLQS